MMVALVAAFGALPEGFSVPNCADAACQQALSGLSVAFGARRNGDRLGVKTQPPGPSLVAGLWLPRLRVLRAVCLCEDLGGTVGASHYRFLEISLS